MDQNAMPVLFGEFATDLTLSSMNLVLVVSPFLAVRGRYGGTAVRRYGGVSVPVLPRKALLPLSTTVFSPTPTPTAQGTEKASRAWVDEAVAFGAPQNADRHRVVVPKAKTRMQSDRSVTLCIRFIFGHNTEYKPNIFPCKGIPRPRYVKMDEDTVLGDDER
jgi:hypothetical protein